MEDEDKSEDDEELHKDSGTIVGLLKKVWVEPK